MAYLLGCALSARIAAVGGVAGVYTLPQQECTPTRPVPMIVLHGTADPIVPYLGGKSGPGPMLPVIPEWVDRRAMLNGCATVPQQYPATLAITGFVYLGCNQNAGAVFHSIRGGGHTSPGAERLPEWLTRPTTQQINATNLMWEFFQRSSISGHRNC